MSFTLASAAVNDFIRRIPKEHSDVRVVQCSCALHGLFDFKYDASANVRPAPCCPKCKTLDDRRYLFGRARADFLDFTHYPIQELDEEKTFENFDLTPEKKRVFLTMKRFADRFPDRLLEGKAVSSRGAILLGKTGTGKSHLASAVCNALKDYAPVYISASTFFDLYLAGFIDVIRLTKAFAKLSLLVVDEVGRTACTPHELRRLQSVLDARTHAGLPTIFIANLDLAGIAPVLGDAIASRVKGQLWPVLCPWADYRPVITGRAVGSGEEFF